mmetsp:Transcript_55140/g.139256  ORF Transcript_55140/g.139256 Transcript_55140/m.139256 type:complete len:172 (+) Transcript_55140:121-636(+)
MARVGVANHMGQEPAPRQDAYWRYVIKKGQQDHAYSVFNEPFPKASYAHLSTTSNDFQSRTWQVLHHARTAAAGKSSFHHSVAKPSAGVVRASAASGSFERERCEQPRGTPTSHAGRRMMLQNSASAPCLPPPMMEGQMSDRRAPRVLESARLSTAGSRRSTSSSRRSHMM